MTSGGVAKLISNTGALFALQLANYILPFIILPFLTRTLGTSLFGVVMFGLSMVQIACIITDFGFNLSATRKIANNQSDIDVVKKVVAAVHVCKIILLLPIILFLFVFISFQTGEYGEYSTFFWLLLIPVIGQTFQPIWLFQGLERMGVITIFMVLARGSYVVFALLWVSSPHDYEWVAIANGVAQVLGATLAIYIMVRAGYSPRWPGWKFVIDIFNESIEFFWSRAAVATYTSGGALFIGLFSGPVSVAHYSAAEQLYKGAQALFQPVSQALYPYMIRTRDITLFFRILKLVGLCVILGLAIGIFVGEWFLVTLFGPDFDASYPILVVFLFSFCISAPAILCGYPFLGAFGDSRSANISVIYGGGVQLLLLLLLWVAGWVNGLVVAGTVMVVEIFVLAYRAKKVRVIAKRELTSL